MSIVKSRPIVTYKEVSEQLHPYGSECKYMRSYANTELHTVGIFIVILFVSCVVGVMLLKIPDFRRSYWQRRVKKEAEAKKAADAIRHEKGVLR